MNVPACVPVFSVIFKRGPMFSQNNTPKLEWKDLLFFHEKNFILRFNQLEGAKREFELGGVGDFVSLSTFAAAPWLNNNSKAEDNRRQNIWDELQNFYHDCYLEKLTENQKKACLARMEEYLKNHIWCGLTFNKSTHDKPALLIGSRQGAEIPNIKYYGDQPPGYPLGKFGTSSFSKDQVVKLIYLEEDDKLNLNSEHEYYQSLKRISEKLYAKFVASIKPLSAAYWANPTTSIERQKYIKKWIAYGYLNDLRKKHFNHEHKEEAPQQEMKNVPEDANSHDLINKINLFKKIYKALREGQSGWFKTDFWADKQNYTNDQFLETLKKHIKENPKSRTASAWLLTTKLVNEPDPTKVFSEVYKEAFERSGIFKRSLLTSQTFFSANSLNHWLTSNQLTNDLIQKNQENGNSRTAKILYALR